MGETGKHRSTDTATRRWTRYRGLSHDEFAPDSAWIREAAEVLLPPLPGVKQLRVRGEFRPDSAAQGRERVMPGLVAKVPGAHGRITAPTGNSAGPWELLLELPASAAQHATELRLELEGVFLTNLLAWLGRLTGAASLQRFRRQRKNRQLRVSRIETAEGEIIYDFANRHAPYSIVFARQHLHLGLNIAGFLTADLGVGESARCMVRAADAAKLPAALVPLKLHCKNRLGDQTYAARLQETNPHDVNVIHLDPPGSVDLEHHHGRDFLRGKYNIAYFAWELPEFPDAWVPMLDFYDEVWTPSDFTRVAIEMKSPVPVLTMAHSISFPRPSGSSRALRSGFGLPEEHFLFLTLFDLNSYAERKNPRAAIDAFRRARLPAGSATLVVKVQNAEANRPDFDQLRECVADMSNIVLITETLSRTRIYELQAACDCFVSLHRSEGFGLAVAECMYLGKPVISTNWSATAEFVNESNGCPVNCRIVTLERNHGPYTKGATWAEPDIEHAAEWMQKLFHDRVFAGEIGAAARATIEERFSPAVIGARYRRRLEAIAWF